MTLDRWSFEDREQWVEERIAMYTGGADIIPSILPDMRRRAEEEYEDMRRDTDDRTHT